MHSAIVHISFGSLDPPPFMECHIKSASNLSFGLSKASLFLNGSLMMILQQSICLNTLPEFSTLGNPGKLNPDLPNLLCWVSLEIVLVAPEPGQVCTRSHNGTLSVKGLGYF